MIGRLLLCAVFAASAGCGQSELELGERIYLQGTGRRASRLSAGTAMVGQSGPGCAVCHGREGKGASCRPVCFTGAAPALTSDVLKARGYDKQSLRRAIADGLDPSGREFSYLHAALGPE